MTRRQLQSRPSYGGVLLALENDSRFSSGGLTPTAVKYAATTATAGDLVLCDTSVNGSFTVTLPSAATKGTVVGVKKLDSSNYTVTVVGAAGGVTIDLDTNLALNGLGSGATLVADGTNWQIASTAVTNAVAAAASAGTASVAYPSVYSGYWYDRRAFTAGSVVNNSPNPITGSTIYYVPFYTPTAFSYTAAAMITGTPAPTAGQAIRLGIFSVNTMTGAPNTLLADVGLYSLPATATTVVQLNVTGTLAAGWSYLALSVNSVTSTAGPLSYLATYGFSATSGFSNASFTGANIAQTGIPAGPAFYTQAGNSTAAAFGTVGTTTASATPGYLLTATNNYFPLVFFKAA